MSKIFRNPDEAGFLAAIEDNFVEEMACFGRSLPEARLYQDEELTWFLTGPTGPNGVLLTRFMHDEQTYIDQRITATLKLFKDYRVPEIGWRIGPTTYPAGLAKSLEAHGLNYKTTSNCMVLQLTNALAYQTPPLPEGLEVREVLTTEELQIKCAIEKVGFNATAMMAQHYFQTYLENGFGPDNNWRHYIGWFRGQAVAIAAVLLHQGVAGIYGVATLPQARQQGIGTAMVRHVLAEIAQIGYALVTLSPTEMSQNIYHHLGFQNYCQLHHYRISFAENK